MARVIPETLVLFVALAGMARAEAPKTPVARWGVPGAELTGGVALTSVFVGAPQAKTALASDGAEGRALATADFDGDRVDDLVAGFATSGGGVIAIYRSDPDVVFPRGAGSHRDDGTAGRDPFRSDVSVAAIPVAVDFLASGDVNADGDADVVVATTGEASLYVLIGDGRGGLSSPRRFPLSGRPTALLVADVNRSDGVADMLVTVDGEAGPRLLVYQHPLGP